MPKIEKERPMPTVKVQTKSDDLTKALEEMLKNSGSMDFELGKNLEITIQEVVTPEQSSESVTDEQQRLLDKFMNIIPSQGRDDATEILRTQRDEAGQFNRNKKNK